MPSACNSSLSSARVHTVLSGPDRPEVNATTIELLASRIAHLAPPRSRSLLTKALLHLCSIFTLDTQTSNIGTLPDFSFLTESAAQVYHVSLPAQFDSQLRIDHSDSRFIRVQDTSGRTLTGFVDTGSRLFSFMTRKHAIARRLPTVEGKAIRVLTVAGESQFSEYFSLELIVKNEKLTERIFVCPRLNLGHADFLCSWTLAQQLGLTVAQCFHASGEYTQTGHAPQTHDCDPDAFLANKPILPGKGKQLSKDDISLMIAEKTSLAEDLTITQRTRFNHILDRSREIFAKNEFDVGTATGKFSIADITLKDPQKIHTAKPYKMPPFKEKIVDRRIQELLDRGRHHSS